MNQQMDQDTDIPTKQGVELRSTSLKKMKSRGSISWVWEALKQLLSNFKATLKIVKVEGPAAGFGKL